jgi:site-specific recombinase XerC
MTTSTQLIATLPDDEAWREALQAAAAFLAGFRSPDTRKGYRRDLTCWLQFCAGQAVHPYVGVRRTHVEVYLRQLEQQDPALANSTLRRRISTSPPRSHSTRARTRRSTRRWTGGPMARCCSTAGATACNATTQPPIVTRLARSIGVTRRVTPHALRRSYITIGLLQGVPLREMQRAARHTRADTTVAYDQSDQSFHRDPTFVLMTATAR